MVVAQCQMLSHNWHKKIVPMGIDNQSFQLAQVKGWSPAQCVHDLLRILFEIQLRMAFILRSYWLDTYMNEVADHASRDRLIAAITSAFNSGYWEPGTVIQQLAGTGAFRVVGTAPVHNVLPQNACPHILVAYLGGGASACASECKQRGL